MATRSPRQAHCPAPQQTAPVCRPLWLPLADQKRRSSALFRRDDRGKPNQRVSAHGHAAHTLMSYLREHVVEQGSSHDPSAWSAACKSEIIPQAGGLTPKQQNLPCGSDFFIKADGGGA